MSHFLKVMLIAGARPNFMKVAPLIRAIEAHNCQQEGLNAPIAFSLVHTGQHYDGRMSDVFFKELGIPAPDVNLEVGSGSHAEQTASVMVRFEPVCLREKPDWVVVVGDVNSTLACTLVCAKLGVKVAHVEAGLRSYDRSMPEEINRIVTDALADLLLTPSADANENLLKEGVARDKIQLVGNIMIDALVANLERANASRILDNLGLQPKDFALVTLHRPANVDDPEVLQAVLGELEDLSRRMPVVFPMHPRTRKMIQNFGLGLADHPALKILEPVGYHDSLCLTQNARLVITDSGGLQEETTYFGTPCLTLRPNTERPVTISHGTNRLTSLSGLRDDIEKACRSAKSPTRVPPLWDGRTAARVLHHLLCFRRQVPAEHSTCGSRP